MSQEVARRARRIDELFGFSPSMQKVTINRVLRLVEAAGLVAEVKVKEAA